MLTSPILHVCMPRLQLQANVMFASPMKTIITASHTGVYGDINFSAILGIWQNCIAWSMYATTTDDAFLFAANLPGALMSLSMLMRLYSIAEWETRARIEWR